MNIHNSSLRNACSEVRVEIENGVLIERKAENSSPTFWLKIWRKFWFWRGKTGRVWCPEKWWFLLRLWFGILFCWRDEKFMLLPSQFWMACSTVLHKYNATSGHAVIYVGPLRWSFGNFHGCSRGNIIWLGV